MDTEYFVNHQRVRRFPWSLYHRPIERDLTGFLADLARQHDRPRVLAIGCGLMQELEDAPDSARFTVVDIDRRAVDAVLERGDPRVVAGGVVEPEEPLRAGNVQYHGIYAKEVIEHIVAWRRYLEALPRLLRPDGKIWLSTPNYGEPWLPLLENTALEVVARRSGFTRKGLHPTRFSRKTLRRALEESGFGQASVRVVSCRLALVARATRMRLDSP